MSTPAKKSAPTLADRLAEDKKNENTKPVVQEPENSDNGDPLADAIGPDNDKEDVIVDVPDATEDKADTYNVSPSVVALNSNKTPAELAAESPAETAERYNIDNKISDQDADNPRVQVYRDTLVNQVPSGTHLHPDIAKDMLNRGIAESHTDNAQVKRQVTEVYDFAPDADTNDKY